MTADSEGFEKRRPGPGRDNLFKGLEAAKEAIDQLTRRWESQASGQDDRQIDQTDKNPAGEADKATAMKPGERSMNIDELIPGTALDMNIFSEQGVLLLRAGTVVSEQFINRLKARGVHRVAVAKVPPKTKVYDIPEEELDGDVQPGEFTDRSRAVSADRPGKRATTGDHPLILGETKQIDLQTTETRRLDRAIAESGYPDILNRPVRTLQSPKLNLQALREEVEAGIGYYSRSISAYSNIGEHVSKGKTPTFGSINEIVGRFAELIRMDPSLALMVLELKSSEGEYLYNHGLNVALLSMTVASQLGFAEGAVTSAGLGALFQDLGMLKVPEKIRLAPRQLTDMEIVEIQHHPIYTMDVMEKVRSLDDITRLICYQSHERCDRSGYPRRRHGMFIHPLARVIAVADTYAAVTCSRPHRAGTIPYEAIVILLHEVKSGRLDRGAVRAFLDCLSLFPVGSYVKLSTGQVARVVRGNGSLHTRPIVIPLNTDGSETDTLLDLAKVDSVKIVAALEGPQVTAGGPLSRMAG